MEVPDGIKLTAFDEEFFADPYVVYARLRASEPVHADEASFYGQSWTLSAYDTVSRLLRDPGLSVNPATIGQRRDPRADNAVTLREPDLMGLDNPDHQRLRHLVQRAFTPSSVTAFAPRIRQLIAILLGDINTAEFDLLHAIAKPLPTMVIAEFIGADSGDHKDFKHWTDALTLQGYPSPTAAQWDAIVAADAAQRDYFTALIKQRRMAPQDDLVSRLIAAQEKSDNLTDSEILDMCCLLLGAGNFTTTYLITNAVYNLLQYGAGNADAGQIVEETLRFDSPVLAVRRFNAEPIDLGDTTIPAGCALNLLTGSANHDPACFEDPDTFKPDRDASNHIAFGRGIHHCLGASLARLESRLVLEALQQRYPNMQLISHRRNRRMDFRGFSELVIHT